MLNKLIRAAKFASCVFLTALVLIAVLGIGLGPIVYVAIAQPASPYPLTASILWPTFFIPFCHHMIIIE